jgi:hypothetical protein
MRICVPLMATSSRIFRRSFRTERVAVGVFVIAAEGAEGALGGADVGVVDVAIDDVGAVILRMHPLRDGVRPLAQIVQRRRRVVKLQRLGVGEASVFTDRHQGVVGILRLPGSGCKGCNGR